MLGRYKMSSSDLFPDSSCRHSSGWCGIVDSVPLSLKVTFSCDSNSLVGKRRNRSKMFDCKSLKIATGRCAIKIHRGSSVALLQDELYLRPPFISIQSSSMISCAAVYLCKYSWYREHSPVNVRTDLFDVNLLVAPGQELLVICDVEEINLQVQVDGWSLP